MWPCKFEQSWVVPQGLCFSLLLSHSLCSASIQTMNGQGSNHSPHLSDQIQLENEENPRQAQPFLRCVLHGRGHPALSSREYFPLLVSWPFWKTGTPAFGDPLLGLSRCVWPLHMLINLPNDALSTREPFILSPWAAANQYECQKVLLAVSWPCTRSVCAPVLSPPLVSLHMTDGLLTLPGQPECDTAKVKVTK